MYVKEGGRGFFLSNESGVSMSFRVGLPNCLIHKTATTASTVVLKEIKNFRIMYREAFPTPEQLSLIMSSTIVQNIPNYDV
jgi:hypothetical protein